MLIIEILWICIRFFVNTLCGFKKKKKLKEKIYNEITILITDSI